MTSNENQAGGNTSKETYFTAATPLGPPPMIAIRRIALMHLQFILLIFKLNKSKIPPMRNSIRRAYRIFLRVCHNLEPDITSDKGNKPKTVKGRCREGSEPGVATIYDYYWLYPPPANCLAGLSDGPIRGSALTLATGLSISITVT